jgi:DNA-binding NarL/FixJ family response regulator
MVDDVKCRIVLFSHSCLIAEGLHSIFAKCGDFVLVARCDRTCDVETVAAAQGADIILVDTGTSVTLTGLGALCQAERSRHVALWGTPASPEFACHSIDLGVRGIIPSDVSLDILISALKIIRAGRLWFTKQLLETVMTANRHSLTRREGQLITLLAQGLKNKELAYKLGLAEGTVKVYFSRLFKRLGVNDRFQLSLYALRNVVSTHGDMASSCGEAPAIAHGGPQTPNNLILPSMAGGGPARQENRHNARS